MKYILLADWAKIHGVPIQQAKDMARRGKLKKVARLRAVKHKRWMVPESTQVPHL